MTVKKTSNYHLALFVVHRREQPHDGLLVIDPQGAVDFLGEHRRMEIRVGDDRPIRRGHSENASPSEVEDTLHGNLEKDSER